MFTFFKSRFLTTLEKSDPEAMSGQQFPTAATRTEQKLRPLDIACFSQFPGVASSIWMHNLPGFSWQILSLQPLLDQPV